jgi:hypothetical protein
MTPTRLPLAAAVLVAVAGPAVAQPRAAAAPAAAVTDLVAAPHREAVGKVVARPTLTARYAEPAFAAPKELYAWMLDHPDRVSLAWTRLGVPCVEIRDAGNGRFVWTDEHGSELTWQAVGRFADGLVWYATGRVKAAALLPMVPVKAVAVVRYPAAGAGELKPEVAVYFQSESRAANAVMRMLGPAAPKAAEDGAEQLLYFFSGVAGYLQKHPEKVQTMLGPKQ